MAVFVLVSVPCPAGWAGSPVTVGLVQGTGMRALRASREFWLYPQSCSNAEGTGTEIRRVWWSLDPDALQVSWSVMVVGKPEIKQK